MSFFWWLVIIFGVLFLLASIWGIKCYRHDMKRWNKGFCTKCGTKLDLVGFRYGNPVYKCPKCGHEICIWWTRTI